MRFASKENHMSLKLYAITTELNNRDRLLRCAANVGVLEERLISGITEATLLCQAGDVAAEIERLLRSPFAGGFGSGYLVVKELTVDEFDQLLES